MDGSPSQGWLTLHHASCSHFFPDHLGKVLSLNNKNIAGHILVLKIYSMFGESHSPPIKWVSELFALPKDF